MRVKGFLPKRPFLCRINAAVAIDQKCHQADRKKCKPIFHTKYFHSDQNRSQKSIGCASKHRRVSKCRADHRWQSCQASQYKTKVLCIPEESFRQVKSRKLNLGLVPLSQP